MDDQRQVGDRLDGADAAFIQPGSALRLQMHIANRDRHRVNAGLTGKLRCLTRVCSGGLSPAMIADKADLALASYASPMRHFGNTGRLVDILRQRFLRAVIHQRGKTTIQRDAAFLE